MKLQDVIVLSVPVIARELCDSRFQTSPLAGREGCTYTMEYRVLHLCGKHAPFAERPRAYPRQDPQFHLIERTAALARSAERAPLAFPPSGTGYKHAVIATDFAADSARAARTARQLFPDTSATLFHAYQVPFEAKLSSTVPQATLQDYRRRAAEQAHSELAAFANATQWSDAPRVVRHGPPGVRVREYAAETAADLIVTGSEEVPRLQRALLGSVSLDLVTDSTCDVLLARTAPATR